MSRRHVLARGYLRSRPRHQRCATTRTIVCHHRVGDDLFINWTDTTPTIYNRDVSAGMRALLAIVICHHWQWLLAQPAGIRTGSVAVDIIRPSQLYRRLCWGVIPYPSHGGRLRRRTNLDGVRFVLIGACPIDFPAAGAGGRTH